MILDAQIECGNIVVDSIEGDQVWLSIRPDSEAHYFQWFYFRASGSAKRQFTIRNAAEASYPLAWDGYRVLASSNGDNWMRLPTQYDGTALTFQHETESDEITSYAFFVPYFEAQREQLLKDCAASPFAVLREIGQSFQGQSLQAIIIGDESRDVPKIWVIARQHAGEPMAEWAAEGVARMLIDPADDAAAALRAKATIYLVPNANPDGSALGNLRANAAGVDLNRAWDKPTDKCPEITALLDAIKTTGVDYFLDLHGDETRPYIWIVSPGVSISPEANRQVKWVELELARLNAEVQPPPPSIQGVSAPDDLGMSINYLAATYGCPGWIAELPFKEPIPGNDSLLADGCIRFGRTCVAAFNVILE